MRVLVTGGYGFIGSFVSERFYKEGHEVWIIDNLSKGSTANLSFKPTFYQLHVEDARCEEVFKVGRFDVVVHLAAQVDVTTSMNHPEQDAQSNIMGLLNMLRLSHTYKVGHFIFASSAAIYGTQQQVPLNEDVQADPISPYGIHKWFGEEYCRKWSEVYNVPTLRFRFSNVYGPRQSSSGEGGVISIFMNKMTRQESLTIFGDGTQTRDFIYVEDIADAIYRSSQCLLTGTYNLSTNKEISLNGLIGVLANIEPLPEVVYAPPKQGDIHRSVLDNTRIKRDLDWVPLYSVEEGLTKTYQWFRQGDYDEKPPPLQLGKRLRAWLSRDRSWFIYLENAAVFVFVAMLTLYPPIWLEQLAIDFKMIYILFIGIVYGLRHTMIAVLLSIGLYGYQQISLGRDWVSMVYDTDSLYIICLYVMGGMLLGFTTDKRQKDLGMVQQQLQHQEERYEFLKQVLQDTTQIKSDLQRKMLNSKDSIGRIYHIVNKMDSFEPEQVMTSAVSVIDQIMEADANAIYSSSSRGYYRMRAHSKKDYRWKNSFHIDDHKAWGQAINEQKIWVNRELEPSLPMMVAPVVHAGETVAVVTVFQLPFERLDDYTEHLLRIVVDLFANSLARAMSYVDATKKDRFINNTRLLNLSAFRSMVEQKIEAKRSTHMPYTLLAVYDAEDDLEECGERVLGLLRETDYVSVEYPHRLLVLLSNTNDQEALFVCQRIRKLNLQVDVLQELAIPLEKRYA